MQQIMQARRRGVVDVIVVQTRRGESVIVPRDGPFSGRRRRRS